MKALIIIFGIVVGIIISHLAFSNDKKNSEAQTSVAMTFQKELELLGDYIQAVDTSFLNKVVNYEIYNSNYELIRQGHFIEGEDITNEEVRNLFYDSDYVAFIGNVSIYILAIKE